jgi:hypothetical protein
MSRSIRFLSLLLVSLVALGGVFGCSNDPVAGDNPATDAGLVRGDVGLTYGDFDLTVETAGDPNQPVVGPFVIRGRNIHYDDEAGALVADLYVVNHSRTAFPEPIGLTFVRLLPEGVEVLNPDNDIHGDGAAIVFGFANDDGVWTPGEVSLARPVQFKTPEGQSVAFVARIDVGTSPRGGAIGGLVWHDRNSNGSVDPGEEGLGGVPVIVTTGGPESPPEILRRTLTDRTGHYRFDGLRAGLYLVQREALDKLVPTTPTTIQVILVQDGDDVSDFLDANFGCLVQTPPDSALVEVGDWVDARGEFGGVPPRLLARMLDVKDCTVNPSFTADGDSCVGLPIELRGPVTDIDVANRRIQVMNSWLYVPPDSAIISTNVFLMLDLEDISIGDRVRAVCTDERGPVAPMALELAWWNEPLDGAMGFVRQVIRREDGPVLGVVVLDTRIDFTDLTAQP